MNMASIGTLISVFIITCVSAGHTTDSDFVQVKCNSETTGPYGLQSLLECVIHVTAEVSNPEIRVVVWTKMGSNKPVLVFHNTPKETEGYAFAEPSWNNKNMNVSLLITNTAVKHEGNYECMVITNCGDAKGNIDFKVAAKYKKPTVQSISKDLPQGEDAVLICDSDGGYPKGQLLWFDKHNSDWTKSSEMQAEQGENGLFKLSSKLTLLSGSNLLEYTCVVRNASGGKEGEATFQMTPERTGTGKGELLSGNPSKIVAPVVVIGSLIVGLLLLLFFKRRSQQARRHSTTPLMAKHQEVCTCDVNGGDYQDKNNTCNMQV